MCQFRPIHLSVCQLQQLQTSSVHPSDNSVQTLRIFSFFGQTFRTPTCVHPSPMDNILSDWAQSPFIPITIHLHTFVPILAHPVTTGSPVVQMGLPSGRLGLSI